MSFNDPTAFGIIWIGAELVEADDKSCHWLKIEMQEKRSIWHDRTPVVDKMTIHFEEEALPKFERLAALINETFGENTTQETSSEV